MATMAVGNYQTACEASPHKIQIDQWLNEGKSAAWISKELKSKFNEFISDKSVLKYRKYRDEFIKSELENDPNYQGKMQMLNQNLVDGIGKIRKVDVIGRLADTIDQCADMLEEAKFNEIQIRNAQDMRFISQTMLDAIKLYGDTVLKAQRFDAINEDPSLLKPTTINVNVKTTLIDILKETMAGGGGFDMIDQLRRGNIEIPKDKDDDAIDIGGDENGY